MPTKSRSKTTIGVPTSVSALKRPAAELTQVEAARRMGIPLNRLNEVIRGKRSVSADTALRLARLLDTSAEIWLGLQNDWDPWHAALALRKAGPVFLGPTTPTQASAICRPACGWGTTDGAEILSRRSLEGEGGPTQGSTARCVQRLQAMHGLGRRFVYIIRSQAGRQRHYLGTTPDPDRRLEWHNHGPSGHTVEHRSWSFVVVLEFPTEQHAVRFEKYLKTGSGRAFAARHFNAKA